MFDRQGRERNEMNRVRNVAAVLTLIALTHPALFCPSAVAAGLRLGDICRLKGQESNTLHGLGLVVGLRGHGLCHCRNSSRRRAAR